MGYTFNPFTGTLDAVGSTVTPAALSRVNDTNVTLTLGGTPLTALLQAASLTLGWSGQLGVSRGGTALSTIASGSILAANSLDTLSAITSTSALKALQNNAGTVSWNASTGTGNSVFGTAPTFVTSIIAPIVYGDSAASGNLLLQSTSNSTRGTVQTADLVQLATSAQAFSAAGIYLDIGTAAATISSSGSITALRYAATATFTSNGAAGGAVALFNAQFTAKDDGTARTLAESIILSSNATYTATIAGGLTLSDVAGIPAYTTIYHAPTFNRTGAGTGTATSVAAVYVGSLGNVAVGFTVTNWIGLLIDKPTVGGTLTNFFGVKNNGAAATNYWFLYETGGMQSSHKGKMRFGDNTAPGALVELAAGTATANTSPLKYTSGTNLTAAEAGATEYDGVQYYQTIDTSSGRGALPVEQYVHLAATGGAITTIANFFGATTNISLVASAYYLIEIVCFFLKDASASVVTWTFTNSAAPTGQNIEAEFAPITGIVTGTPTATALFGQTYNDATAAKTIATGSLSANVNHFCKFRIMLKNGTGTSLKIQATVTTGNITPGIGSYWRARRLSPNNIGTLAA